MECRRSSPRVAPEERPEHVLRGGRKCAAAGPQTGFRFSLLVPQETGSWGGEAGRSRSRPGPRTRARPHLSTAPPPLCACVPPLLPDVARATARTAPLGNARSLATVRSLGASPPRQRRQSRGDDDPAPRPGIEDSGDGGKGAITTADPPPAGWVGPGPGRGSCSIPSHHGGTSPASPRGSLSAAVSTATSCGVGREGGSGGGWGPGGLPGRPGLARPGFRQPARAGPYGAAAGGGGAVASSAPPPPPAGRRAGPRCRAAKPARGAGVFLFRTPA